MGVDAVWRCEIDDTQIVQWTIDWLYPTNGKEGFEYTADIYETPLARPDQGERPNRS